MTPEMAFECVLLSSDSNVLSILNRSLIDLSITTRICFHASQAQRAIADGNIDLLAIDLVEKPVANLLDEIWKPPMRQKPTVLGILDDDQNIPGVHVKLLKPITAESAVKSLKAAYSRMVMEFRHHARCALMNDVDAIDECKRTIPITVMDIGYGGVGLRLRRALQVGQVLSFRLLLPGAPRQIQIEARILWMKEFGRAGCEFVRMPPVDLSILRDWLKRKIIVKQPCVPV